MLRRGRRRPGGVAAAVCCRWDDGGLAFGLVSTKDGARWTFPKGHRERGESLAATAAREAREEAGVVGRIDERRLLDYRYPSRRGGDDLVVAFLLHVTEDGAPEETFRRKLWCGPEEAARRLAEARDPLQAGELERVLLAAVREAPASRERTLDGPPRRGRGRGRSRRRRRRRRRAKA